LFVLIVCCSLQKPLRLQRYNKYLEYANKSAFLVKNVPKYSNERHRFDLCHNRYGLGSLFAASRDSAKNNPFNLFHLWAHFFVFFPICILSVALPGSVFCTLYCINSRTHLVRITDDSVRSFSGFSVFHLSLIFERTIISMSVAPDRIRPPRRLLCRMLSGF